MNQAHSLAFLERIDAICDSFEAACRNGQTPAIMPLLVDWEGDDRTELFRHLLELEVDFQRRSGESPSEQALLASYPEFPAVVRQVLGGEPNEIEETTRLQPLEETHAPQTTAARSAKVVAKKLGRYEIVRTLGEGAMGTVYLAHDTELDRQVALKVPKFSADDGKELMQRFYREARSAATLRHQHICPVFDIGKIDGTLYITMAYIEGHPLSDLVSTDSPPTPQEAARIIAKLAGALAEAHRHGVVHRDLKPTNIMVDQHGEPIVMDFGLARQVHHPHATQLTQSGAIVGTPAYMSPEQVSGRLADIGPACDIYSLGVVFYQLLTGRLPFAGDLLSVLYKIANETPPAPAEFISDVDPALEAVCLRMMSKRIEDRYGSMDDVVAALDGNAIADSLSTVRARETVRRKAVAKSKWARSIGHWPIVVAGGVIVLAALTGLAVWLGSGEPAKAKPEDTAVDVQAPPVAVVPFDAPQARQHQQNWAKHLHAEFRHTNSLGMTMLLIPPGEFEMGSDEATVADAVAEANELNLGTRYVEFIEAEMPQTHQVIGKPFYLSQTEVTVGQFKQFVEASGYQTTAETSGLGGFGFVSRQQQDGVNWRNPEIDQTDQHPVIEITLADAEQFCHWLGKKEGVKYSLPTEVQWEWACRAGTTTSWSCGDAAETLDDFAWHWGNSENATHPVKSKSPNAFGLYDMHGSVREWCARLPNSPETGILRGGAFLKPPLLLRSAQRIAFKVVTPYPYHGFRVVAEVKPPAPRRSP